MLRILYGKLKPGRGFDFINYFKNDEKVRTFNEANPEGVEFVGAYMVHRGDADHDYEVVWKMTNYAALDQWDFSNERVKIAYETFWNEVGFIFETLKEKFVREVKEITTMDEGLFKEILEREKARAK